MTNNQVKDLFESVVAGGPADLLDVDRAVSDGRRRRRLRSLATAGSAAAVLVAVGVLLLTALPRGASDPSPGANSTASSPSSTNPTSSSATPTPTTPAKPQSPVVTVSSGQKVDLGSGSYLTVTRAEKCYYMADPPNPATPECKSLTDGNQAPRSISLQSSSAGAGKPEILTGIYTGTDAATITATFKGVTRAATIVKLGAHPASLVYFLVWPTGLPSGATMNQQFTIEALDANGRSLAKL